MKPNVLILIASDEVGGPGKNLMLFLKYANRSVFNYILCNYSKNSNIIAPFSKEILDRNFNYVLLKQRFLFDPSMILQVRSLIRDRGVNILETHGYKSDVIGYFIKKLRPIQWISFLHGNTAESKRVNLYNTIDRAVIRHSDSVVVVSESLKRIALEAGVPESKIQVIYNAIDSVNPEPSIAPDELKQSLGIRSDEKVIGIIGRLSHEKGHHVFLDALGRLRDYTIPLKTLIIGDGPERCALEDAARTAGLDGQVIFTGYQNNISNYYGILDLLVLPSLSEGLPNVVLESLRFGVPVIATRVGGVPEIITNGNGWIVPPNDPSALAEKIREVISDGPLLKETSEKGKTSLYPRFNPEARARQILDLYQSMS